ncbi:sugar ABC transporter substrate-binding protein [Agromyces rhizosphaerae]|uniref:Sugar ABC transporter substrate-binding protein n=1 Tax=Agromyces rhizosphaerae TaxID=88374 RepID=A0A9W6FN64_9MICO|nr:extracellular solute-binding protein [Agromyces rhizosphaerae]GLI26639.1 sugar ABC transporter substrate-binding protein [Agromyces rhizosphaerae]
MSITRTSLVVMAAATALVTAGCTSSDGTSDGGSGPVTIEVSAWKGNDVEPAGLPELIEKFEAENPDVAVELTYIGRGDTDVVLPPRLQGGNPPDVMMTDMALVDQWSSQGLLVDLGTDSEWYERIPDPLQGILTTGDAAYIMPLEVIGMGNFVNTDLLAEAGVEAAPQTIDELKDACVALSDAGINPMIFTGGFSAALTVIANGLESSSDAAGDLGSGAATFVENSSFNDTVDLIGELSDAQCFDASAQAGLDPWSTALTEFQAGNFAMMPQGAWNIAAFDQVDGLNYEFTPIPGASAPGVALDLFGFGWSIAEASAHQEAARAFVDFFADPENLQVLLDAESAYSPFEDAASGTPELTAAYDSARADGAIIAYPFATLEWPKPLEQEIWDSLTAYLLEPSSSGELLERWDTSVADAN